MTPSVFLGEIDPDDLENAGGFVSGNLLPMRDYTFALYCYWDFGNCNLRPNIF